MAVQGTKALEVWCKKVTQGYKGVNIVNMTTSWRSGLAFCAIIHHYCPELIDFNSLDPDDVFGNNELAFTIAEQQLGIPSLLDPQDMVESELLDRLSILTYLAQYFQAFNSQTVQTRVRRIGSISKSPSTSSDLVDSATRSRQPPKIGRLNDPCKQCNKAVEIISRVNVGGRILHRTCFKCARCDTQLSLASYYETETGDFCCEVCPDEEKKESATIKANKDLVSIMSADSGNSSDDDNDIVHEDTTIVSGHEIVNKEDKPDVHDNAAVESIGCENVKDESDDNHEECDDDCDNAGGAEKLLECEKNIDSAVNLAECDVETITNKLDKSSNLSLNNNATEEEIGVTDSEPIIVTEQDTNNSEDKTPNEENDKDSEEYPDDKNPFGDDSEEEVVATVQTTIDIVVDNEKETEKIKPEDSTNPFGSDFESEDESGCVVETRSKPNSSLNPFGSDLSDDEDLSKSTTSLQNKVATKKKRRAPLPPGVTPTPAPRTSLLHTSTPESSQNTSNHRGGTAKRLKDADNLHRRSQIMESIQGTASRNSTSHLSIAEDTISIASSDTASRTSSSATNNRSSQLSVSMFANMAPNKSEEGQWRKKKGPAPARPIPPKRTVKKLPRKAINQELVDIEVKQGELERQGVKLEKSIREICAASDAEEGANRDSLGPEAEDLIIQLFDLVNEKNELFRRQTELVYMKKENRLEEQHADCEYQIRVIMSKAESQRTDEDKRKEEKLISKLVEIVGLRNEIVDCLEMDRLRELDEDTAIENHMSNYAAVKPVVSTKKGGLEKILKIKKKKKKDRDSEKDIDTSEITYLETKPEKTKKKSAKKKILSLASKGLASSKQLAFPHNN